MGRSIFHQPVHIATPVPSPPPSPAGPGGKGGKKQNYQTNQNFPFLYPPLDGASNDLGSKGGAGLQDRLVGKKWEGSDIPASILEAAQLFASRMRMSRSLRQLWDAREEFIKHDRGWQEEDKKKKEEQKEALANGHAVDDEDLGDLKLSDEDSESECEDQAAPSTGDLPPLSSEHVTSDPKVQERLDIVETFYVSAMAPLSSARC